MPSGARPYLLVLLAALSFSASGPIARWARPTSPLALAFGRLALASLALAALASLARSGPRPPLRTSGLRVLAAGALLGAHFACFQWGLELTSLPAALALVSLEPMAVVLVAWLGEGLRPTRGEGVGVGLATLGALVVGSGAGVGEHRLVGDALVLVAVALYGGYVAAARGARELPAADYAARVYGVAAVGLGLVLGGLSACAGAPTVPAHGLLAVALLALLPTLVGHTAMQTAARSLSPAAVALVSPGETVGGLAIGALSLGARPSSAELAGAALVVVGSVLTIVGRRTTTAPRAEGGGPPG